MALVTTKQLMLDAQAGGYAIGAFNVENMEMVQAVVAAAEELRAPVIMQTTPSTVKYADLAYFYANVKTAAEQVGVPDDAVRECVRRGMCKVNYATDLRIAFTKGVTEYLREYPDTIDPKKYNARGREEVKKYVMDKIRVCGSCGKA